MEIVKAYNDAVSYHVAVKGLWARRKVDNETIYNIVSMAIEQYSLALTWHIGFIPVHSGLTSVFRELKKRIHLPDYFIEQVRFLNRFMVYCSLDRIASIDLSDDDISRMILFLDEFGSLVKLRIYEQAN